MKINDDQIPDLTTDNGVATIQFRRARFANRLVAQDLDVLMQLFRQVQDDRSARVLVIKGSGRHFCSGYDMEGLEKAALKGGDEFENPFEPFVDSLWALDKPVLAALHGGVYGGAIDLALACDLRHGTLDSRMSMPALRIGLQYYVGGLQRYVSELGMANTRRIFMAGATFDAPQMLAMGVLHEVHADVEALEHAVSTLARQLAGLAPMAAAGTKRVLRQIATGLVNRPHARQSEAACLASADLREGLAAAREKRSPQFAGR